ncbi:hypothetical protein ABRY23_04355 [Melioribacteraceae bacterium 4301-Me]|uniref:hypothetical protein n=1 Tax=Pyranulibacter aquaticus TaxID=3163344 RepID=UPI0035964223
MKRLILLLVPLLVCSVFTASNYGQSPIIGKEFTVREANELFGKPTQTVRVDAKFLKKLLDNSGEYFMFTIKNGKAYFANKHKKLFNDDGGFNGDETMWVVSTSVLKHLLSKGANTMGIKNKSTTATSDVLIEQRSGTLTVTYNDATTEMAWVCPPSCPY